MMIGCCLGVRLGLVGVGRGIAYLDVEKCL